MFRGFISLFTSGAIFSPLVLLGIISGIYSITHLEAEQIRALVIDWYSYALIAFVSFVYVFGFKRIYGEGGLHLDIGAMFLSVIANVAKFILAYFLSMSFVILISF